MNIFTSIILGVVQGLTEFLPVSSSGHLVVAQALIPGFSQPGVLFDVVLHLGTTLAVVIFYYKKIVKILSKNWKYIWLLIIGTIPAGLFGILLGDALEKSFSDLKAIGVQFLITGVICILIDKFSGQKETISVKNSLLIGVAQAIAKTVPTRQLSQKFIIPDIFNPAVAKNVTKAVVGLVREKKTKN